MKAEAKIEDELGRWLKAQLCGTPDAGLTKWGLKSRSLFISLRMIPRDQHLRDEELFYTTQVKEVDPELEWKSNCLPEPSGPHQSLGELGGVAELAEEMGFGSPVRGRRAGRAQETEGTALPPAAPRNFPVDGRELSYSPQRADEGEKEKGREAKKKKKAKDKVRVLEMLKQSRWSWRGSSLDPEFKRPKIKLRRGKGDSDSSSSSSHSGGPEFGRGAPLPRGEPGQICGQAMSRAASQDGAPAVQEDPVQAFACQQGAGARHGSILPPDSLASEPVAPISERGFVALCGHGPALRGGGRPSAGCQHATPEIPRSHHARETPGGGIKDGVDPGDPQQRRHRRGAPDGCKGAEAGRAFAGLRGEAPLDRGQRVSKRSSSRPRWANLAHSLPAKGSAGVVDALEVCSGGVKDFLESPHKYLKPQGSRKWLKPPRVRVGEVAQGLIERGWPLEEAYKVEGEPLLGGRGSPEANYGQRVNMSSSRVRISRRCSMW